MRKARLAANRGSLIGLADDQLDGVASHDVIPAW